MSKNDLFKNIEKVAAEIDEFYENNKQVSKDELPDIKLVVYQRISYPIVYEISNFFYLGGKNLYFVMKNKCIIKTTPKGVSYYEAFASQQDIVVGKSPIIPVGCSNFDLKKNIYPKGTEELSRKI